MQKLPNFFLEHEDSGYSFELKAEKHENQEIRYLLILRDGTDANVIALSQGEFDQLYQFMGVLQNEL